MKWIKATDATTGLAVFLRLDLARVIASTPEGTVVSFDEADQITVKEEPEVLIGAADK